VLYSAIVIAALLLAASIVSAAPSPVLYDSSLAVPAKSEGVMTVTAKCAPCDWGVAGREAVLLEIRVDGKYSQHLALTRGESPAEYRVMLGPLTAGTHRIRIAIDRARSARDSASAAVTGVETQLFTEAAPEYAWLSRAPILRARPGTVEKFSDFPLVMYAEHDVQGESGTAYRYQYTVIFTNEDGGTPTDRLMATWGRTTDIEFIYGLTTATPAHEEIQAEGHKWIAFNGPRLGAHPVVCVA
jgi:hypothetical protein